MYFGGVSDAQMRVRCSIGMHERKKQNENKNIFALYLVICVNAKKHLM